MKKSLIAMLIVGALLSVGCAGYQAPERTAEEREELRKETMERIKSRFPGLEEAKRKAAEVRAAQNAQ